MSDENYNINEIPTFVAFPVESFETNMVVQKSEQFRVIKNALIKTLSDGSVCIIDANDPNLNQDKESVTDGNKAEVIASNSHNLNVDKTPVIAIKDEKQTNSVYRCPKCKEVFDKIASYRKHMIWHRNIKKYKCDKCSISYNVETNLKIHMAMHVEGKPTCPLCNISFQRLASLKSHLMLHQVEEVYTCEECSAEFEKEEELNKHLHNHFNNSRDNNLICSYCKVQFDDHKKYKEHISHHIKVKRMVLSGKKSRKTHGNKDYPHICSVCLKSFSRVSLLERHLRVHSGERPFICQHCNRGFNQKGTLQIHLSKHTGIKPFHCTLCSAKFNQKGNLRVHVEKTHTAPMPGVKTYKCSHCTCIFKKIASLNVHITKSHASNEDVGSISNIMNRLKELEEQTTTITSTMKPAEKQIVEQNIKVLNEIKESRDLPNTSYVRLAESFLDGTVRRYLVMQRKVNDVRWYICSYCNKEFKKPSDLIRHTRVHTREKPFMCKQCGASFSLKSTLFCHIKTHIGNNNYTCVICKKKFSSVRSVNLHLRKHSEKQNQQFKCTACNKWFTSIQKAKLHNKEVHTDYHSEKEPIQIIMKQPLLSTPNGLLPVAPPKSQTERNEGNSKQFHCNICNAKFSKMPNLNRHMLLHNGDRKFKCDQCLKSYCTSHALKEHLLYHLGIKNYGCKVCGKKYMTSSLLKRHMISHNTLKPYVCPYCNKNFKSVMLCRKHMNIHKKDINLQIHTLKETGGDGYVPVVENNLLPTEDSVENIINNDEIEIRINQDVQLLSQDATDKSNLIQQGTEQTTSNDNQNKITQQIYQVAPNAIQIITNSSDSNNIQDPNQIQTIFINCDDLQLTDNLYSQTKPEGADGMFFTPLNDLQDASVFNIDPLSGDFDSNNTEICNTHQTFNVSNQIMNSNQINTLNIEDSSNKIFKLNNLNPSLTKTKNDKGNMVLNNVNLNDNLLTNNVPFYSHQELNLLFNLDTEFETNNCDLTNDNLNLTDINLSEVPAVSTEMSHENIFVHGSDKMKKKNLECEKCKKLFNNKNTYIKHINAHTKPKKTGVTLHHCSFCSKGFKKQSDLIRHIRTHTGEKPFACDKCDKRFSLKSTLLSHQRTHNPVSHKHYNCVVCNSFFTSKSSLKVHMTVHTGDKTHGCNYCSMKFRTAAHRKSHETNHHINPSKKKPKNKITNLLASIAMEGLNQTEQIDVPCDQIINGGELENILLQFPGDQLNILNESNQNILTEANQLEPLILQLQSNLLLQDNFIPSSLIQLDDGTLLNVKTIEDHSNASRHGANGSSNNNTISIEKPRNLECDICHKKYASKDVLRKHKKIHGVNKKFPCTKCDKGFDDKEDLEKHEKVHVGYRPYSCMYCTNSFSKEHSLTTHMKRIHDVSLRDSLLLYDLK